MAGKQVTYDANVIQQFAQRLYGQATSIIFISTFIGGVIGGLLGLGGAASAHAQSAIGIAAIVGAAIGGVVGFLRGRERAFKLKLEAQVALCQVQIEKNTNTAHC